MSEDLWFGFEIEDEPEEAPIVYSSDERYPYDIHREGSSEDGMGTYLTVSSNDTLTHLALRGSPESLCGRLITDEKRPSKDLMCDTCQTLAGGSFVNTATYQNPTDKNEMIIHLYEYHPDTSDFISGDYTSLSHRILREIHQEEHETKDELAESHTHRSPFRSHVDESEFEDGKSGIEHHKEDFEDWDEEVEPIDLPVPPSQGYHKKIIDPENINDWNKPKDPYDYPWSKRDRDKWASVHKKAGVCENCGDKSDALVQQGNEWHCIGCASKPPAGEISVELNQQVRPQEQKVAASNCEECGSKEDVHPVNDGRKLCKDCRFDYQYGQEEPTAEFDWNDYGDLLRGTKIARNYTRDGIAIDNGFDIMITKEEASKIPFLDSSRITVSEKRECPGCHENHWIQTIASCDTCGEIKCRDCMASINKFLGQCKRCASYDPDIVYEDSIGPEQTAYLSYVLNDEPEEPLFLPSDE